MTKKFEKAKAETIQKYTNILEAIRVAQREESSRCSFCRSSSDCDKCPVDELCGSGRHIEIRSMLRKLEWKVQEGLSLLEKVKE